MNENRTRILNIRTTSIGLASALLRRVLWCTLFRLRLIPWERVLVAPFGVSLPKEISTIIDAISAGSEKTILNIPRHNKKHRGSADTLYNKISGYAVAGFTTVILLLLVIGSAVLLSIGVIGEYVAQIYHEVKQRPLYVVCDLIGTDFPEERRNELAVSLRSWYYTDGDGIYLSLSAADLFFKARTHLIEPNADAARISQAFSALRTQLKLDVGVYEPRDAKVQIG